MSFTGTAEVIAPDEYFTRLVDADNGYDLWYRAKFIILLQNGEMVISTYSGDTIWLKRREMVRVRS